MLLTLIVTYFYINYIGVGNNYPSNTKYDYERVENHIEYIEKANKKSDNFEQVCQKINKFITVTDRELYTKHYERVLYYIRGELESKNDLFKTMNNGFEMGGSYPDNLKVSKPNEFDTVIKLKWPLDASKIKVTKYAGKPAYVEINLKESLASASIANKDIKALIDSEGYLLQNKVLDWMKGALNDVLRDEESKKIGKKTVYILKIEKYKYQVQLTESGPAHTLLVEVLGQNNTDNEPIKFDMDLVLAFPFNEKTWVARRDYPRYMPVISWNAVPKPDKLLQASKGKKNNRAFITSYSTIERSLIKNQGKMKEVIRLFKKMRDNKNLKNLKSYHIKTMFMLYNDFLNETKTMEEQRAFWAQPIKNIFLFMLEKLIDHLKKKELFFYWDSTYNMFSAIPPNQLADIQNKMEGIQKTVLRHIETNPENLYDVFLSKDEIRRLRP